MNQITITVFSTVPGQNSSRAFVVNSPVNLGDFLAENGYSTDNVAIRLTHAGGVATSNPSLSTEITGDAKVTLSLSKQPGA